jgi:predicted glycosyltransferase
MYWHNGRSLGHTAESAKVAAGLIGASPGGVSVAGITGAYRGLDMLPAGVDVVKLPSFSNYDRASGWQLAGRQGLAPDELFRLRADLIDVFLRHYAPDVLIVNHLPRGAEDELVPALSRPRTGKRILTLRGILFDREKTRREYFTDEGTSWIADRFDAIHVHTDPRVFRLEDAYDVPGVLRSRIRYTGYLAESPSIGRVEARAQLGVAPGERLLVASMGGGQGALPIWIAIVDALRARRADFDRAVIVTGPYLEPDDARSLGERVAAESWLTVRSYVDDMAAWMSASDVFVGAAGAGMLGEILASGCNAIVVPRQVREPEQRMHAALLGARGLVRVCELEDVLAGRLAELLADAARAPLAPDVPALVNGARRYPGLVADLLEGETSVSATG